MKTPGGAPGELKASGAWNCYVVQTFEALGLDVLELTTAIGADLTQLTDPDAWVPREVTGRLWREATRQTGDRDLGLRAGNELNLGANNPLTMLCLTASTLFEGLSKGAEYQLALAHGSVLEVELSADDFKICLNRITSGLPLTRQEMEFMAMVLYKFSATMLGRRPDMQEVGFAHPWPGDDSLHRQIFGCDVRFACERDYLSISREDALRPSPHRNPALHEKLEQLVYARVDQKKTTEFSDRVTVIVRATLEGDCNVERVAKTLHVSTRTLQRQLREENTSFRDIVQHCRLEVATGFLAVGATAEDAARRAGFGSTLTFSRAFRRWTGQSPEEFFAAKAAN